MSCSYLYWSDIGSSLGPKIERASLDGRNRIVLTRNVTKPMALSVDYVTNRVYWVDDLRQTLESMLWDGSDRQTFSTDVGLSAIVIYGVLQANIYFLLLYYLSPRDIILHIGLSILLYLLFMGVLLKSTIWAYSLCCVNSVVKILCKHARYSHAHM